MLKSRVVYGALLICTLFLYLFYSDYISFIGIVVTVALLPLLVIVNIISALRLRASLKPGGDTSVMLGGEVRVVLRVENRLAVPISHLRVDLEMQNKFAPKDIFYQSFVFPVTSSGAAEFPIKLASDCCGNVFVKIRRVKIYDMLGISVLTRKLKKSKSKAVSVMVLPESYDSSVPFNHSASPDPDGSRFSSSKQGDDPSQVFGFHEYLPGDRMKNIHWKLSTKLDKIIVKELSLPLGSSICVIPVLSDDKGETEPLYLINTLLASFSSLHSRLSLQEISHDVCIAGKEAFELIPVENDEDFYVGLYRLYEQSPSPLSFISEQLVHEKHNYSRCYCILCLRDIEASIKWLELIKSCCTSLVLIIVADEADDDKKYADILEAADIEFVIIKGDNMEDELNSVP